MNFEQYIEEVANVRVKKYTKKTAPIICTLVFALMTVVAFISTSRIGAVIITLICALLTAGIWFITSSKKYLRNRFESSLSKNIAKLGTPEEILAELNKACDMPVTHEYGYTNHLFIGENYIGIIDFFYVGGAGNVYVLPAKGRIKQISSVDCYVYAENGQRFRFLGQKEYEIIANSCAGFGMQNNALLVFKKIAFNTFYGIADIVSSEARTYYSSEQQKNNKDISIKWKAANTIFQLSPDKWEEAENTLSGIYTTRTLLAEKYAEEHPEKADTIYGYCQLFTAADILCKGCSTVNEQTALSFMKNLVRIYEEGPDLNDMDLFIAFVKKEHILKDKYIHMIDKIPAEAKEAVNLYIRDIIASFAKTVQIY